MRPLGNADENPPGLGRASGQPQHPFQHLTDRRPLAGSLSNGLISPLEKPNKQTVVRQPQKFGGLVASSLVIFREDVSLFCV